MLADYDSAWQPSGADYDSAWDADRLHPRIGGARKCPKIGSPPKASRKRPTIGEPPKESRKRPKIGEPPKPSSAADVNLSTDIAVVRRQLTEDPSRKETSYQAKGADPAAVRVRLARAKCKCKLPEKPCHRAVALKSLQLVCTTFWSLPDLERANLIRSLYQSACSDSADEEFANVEGQEVPGAQGADKLLKMKLAWRLCGKPVCFPMWTHLLGTSQNSIRNAIHGNPDMRRTEVGSVSSPATRHAPQSGLVDIFFLELYQSAAEPLPEDEQCAPGDFAEIGIDNAIAAAESRGPGNEQDPWAEIFDADSLQEWNPDLPNPTQHVAAAVGLGRPEPVLGLPRRYLPHGTPSDLFWMFVSWCQNHLDSDYHADKVPSYSTFWRGWQKWKLHLKPRKSSQHAQCNTCFELQKDIHQHKGDWGSKVRAGRALREHYRHQFQDRCIYYCTRYLSRANRDVLTIIIDTVDRAKFAWPHWPWGRVSKEIAGLNRPRLVLTAAIAHGFCVILFCQHENTNHGSDFFCDVLTRTIEEVWRLCSGVQGSRKRDFPRHLVIQSDNTTSQAKNSYSIMYLSYLVRRCKFLTVTLNFLMVGHTHEDVDQLFALLLSFIAQKSSWETAEELLGYLVSRLRARAWQKGETVASVFLDSVRDFSTWLSPLAMSIAGAFGTRGGIEAPHSFTLKMRSHLTSEEVNQLALEPKCRGVREADGPLDVVCCVKTYMRDTRLQQAPVLTLPQARMTLVVGNWPSAVVPRAAMADPGIESALKLADLCLHDLQMPLAGAALQDLVYQRRITAAPTDWLRAPALANEGAIPAGQPEFPHLPVTSWKLTSKHGKGSGV